MWAELAAVLSLIACCAAAAALFWKPDRDVAALRLEWARFREDAESILVSVERKRKSTAASAAKLKGGQGELELDELSVLGPTREDTKRNVKMLLARQGKHFN